MTRALLAMLVVGALSGCGASREPVQRPEPMPPASATAAAEAWRAKKPPPGERSAFTYPTPELKRLDNGLSVYVVHRTGGVVLTAVVSRRGAAAVPAGKSGLAALTARMLTEGTRTKSSLALAEATESLGATLESDAGRDYTDVSLSTLREDFGRGLELLAEVVKTPAFNAKELERVRAEWLDGLVAERQEPTRAASLVGLRALLGEPRGAPVGGSLSDVKKLTGRDLVQFHASAFVPSRAALLIAGDVNLTSVLPDVERLFGTWRGTSPPDPKPEPAAEPPATRVLVVDRAEAVQTALFAAQPFPPRSEPGHEPREILNQVLGGLFTSRINQNLREEHAYTYGARSQVIATRSWGAFVVSTSVQTKDTGPALTELVRELRAVRDPALGKPLNDAELGRARADLGNRLGAHLEHTSRMAGDLQTLFVHELEPSYFTRYPALIAASTAEQVAREAQRITPDRMIIVAVGHQAAIVPAIEKAGYKVELAPPALLD
jgi:zinc protease